MNRRLRAVGLSALLGALLLVPRAGEAEADAISAASIVSSMGPITATTAVVRYSQDIYNYGDRTICRDTAPAEPAHNCITRLASGSSGSFTLTNLTPETKYNFKITATDGVHAEYSTRGSFETTAPVATAPPAPRKASAGRFRKNGGGFDLRGRRVPAASRSPR